MSADPTLQALRDASPRSRPGFEESIAGHEALRRRITTTPLPSRSALPRPAARRRLIGVSMTAAVALALAAVLVAVTLSATSPPSVFAAAKRALAATTAAPSGTMTMTTVQGGTTETLDTTRWNGDDIAITSGATNHFLGPNRQLLLIGGGAYLQTADAGWQHYASETNVGPKLGPSVRRAHDNVAGNGAEQILRLATGLRDSERPDGTTVYTGTIPSSTADPARNPADDEILAMITDLRTGYDPAAPTGSHEHRYGDDLRLRMTVASDGLVRQISLTLDQPATSAPAPTWSVSYDRLGATPPITAPASSTPTAPAPWSPSPAPPDGPHGG